MTRKCGYVALVGRPNVGKSTLMNHLLGMKLAITSRKPQTTRHNLLGVDTRGDAQAIYVDTPGIHDQLNRQLNRLMVRSATSVLNDVDLIVMLVEHDKWTEEDALVLRHVQRSARPVIAALNKTDLLARREALLPAIERLAGFDAFQDFVPISALKGQGLDALRSVVARFLPEQPHLFPPDQVTDQSTRFLVSEIVREKIMRRLGDELPHRTTVLIEAYDERPHITEIRAVVYVERSGQKRILIGREGQMLKSIGQDARRDIELLLGGKVMLHLWVKVRKGWTNDIQQLRRLGLGEP
jgi:GTP-binding protein Era